MTDDQPSHGARAELLAAARRGDWNPPALPQVPDGVQARRSAVLVLFGVLDSIPAATPDAAVAKDLDVLLQRRAPTLSSHPGQVSFPGGGREAADRDDIDTALREAEEETGLDPTGVEILAALPALPLAVSNHHVTPVLGWWTKPSKVAAVDHAETVEVFRVPVAQLLDPATRFTSTITRAGMTFRGPAFDVDGTIVWGFTAMVLDRLFDACGWTVPWDATVERPVTV
ncbi:MULTISPECIES: CoA pyrophosphatase [unclassified Microbacterium]|uniref:NUDIX hydrolase n=1 Tax=unclassified Microbacterium TaxID=2609290 RepID=UPI001D363880|nr:MULTISPECIES: CoA pyrophosphatase [unclassified Microbacterium]CAH0123154.1 putative Nudix hydrolase NudL [Microbacterium sp. Bi121]HWK79008.1 CoA pyrophosphatase [Microbacterium sp.]